MHSRRFREDEDDDSEDEEDRPVGLLIPIGVLSIIMVATGVVWLLIPIFVLLVSLVSSVTEEKRIRARKDTVASSETPIPAQIDTKPIYDRRKQKEEGVAVGVLIPIGILGWLYFESGFSWVFLIPLFVLVFVFLSSVVENVSHRSKVLTEFERGQGRTVPEIAGSAGVPEDEAIQFIIGQKRKGASDVWFNPATGTTSSAPAHPADSGVSGARGCVYCGFALKPEDRYCPYCGAPIKAVL